MVIALTLAVVPVHNHRPLAVQCKVALDTASHPREKTLLCNKLIALEFNKHINTRNHLSTYTWCLSMAAHHKADLVWAELARLQNAQQNASFALNKESLRRPSLHVNIYKQHTQRI